MTRRTIDGLRACLERGSDERELLRRIEAGLPWLREAYRWDSAAFTQSDIAFLQRLGPARDALRAWVEMEARLPALASTDALEAAIARLTGLKDALGAYAVGATLRKAIHNWRARLGALRAEDEMNRARVEPRIAELERNPRRCRRNHRMAIREGPRGYFWGCTTYPFCHHVALLTREERMYLTAEDANVPADPVNARQLRLV